MGIKSNNLQILYVKRLIEFNFDEESKKAKPDQLAISSVIQRLVSEF